MGLYTLDVYDKLGIIIIILCLCIWLYKYIIKSTKLISKISIFIIYQLAIMSIVLLCYNVAIPVSKTDADKVYVNVIENLFTDVENEKENYCFTNETDYYTTQDGLVCIPIYVTGDFKLNLDDISYNKGLCKNVEIIADDLVENKYVIVFSHFTIKNGIVNVKILNTDCVINIHITDVLSENIILTGTLSSNQIDSNNKTLTILLEYRGNDVDNKTAKMCFSERYVQLSNCTGIIEYQIQGNSVVCLKANDLEVQNKDSCAKIEILEGTMIDSRGKLVNGIVLEFEQKD